MIIMEVKCTIKCRVFNHLKPSSDSRSMEELSSNLNWSLGAKKLGTTDLKDLSNTVEQVFYLHFKDKETESQRRHMTTFK